jgi:hypothetical protein
MTTHHKLSITKEQLQLLEILFSSWPLKEITQHQIKECFTGEKDLSGNLVSIPSTKLVNQWLRQKGAKFQLHTTWTLS